MSETEPIRAGDGNGRDKNGRFTFGNAGGVGAPAGYWRRRLDRMLREEDIESAVNLLRTVLNNPKERAADRLAAAREILDRGCGRIGSTEQENIIDMILVRARQRGLLE
jgi:hypothetical protein